MQQKIHVVTTLSAKKGMIMTLRPKIQIAELGNNYSISQILQPNSLVSAIYLNFLKQKLVTVCNVVPFILNRISAVGTIRH